MTKLTLCDILTIMTHETREQLLKTLEQINDYSLEQEGLASPNRINKTRPKSGRYWCYSCDATLVSKGSKCKKCGSKDKSKHQKV